jgi:DNA-directed RNA polymerase specialized sigma24 family protein
MSDDAEIISWIEKLKEGDDDRAAQAIWENYFDKLAAFARQRLSAFPRRAVDEEDVALSALQSFFRGVAEKRFPTLNDRYDLWKVLVTITARKVVAQRRRHFAQKRGGGRVQGESGFSIGLSDSSQGGGIDQVLGSEPTPELALSLAEQCGDLLSCLDERQKPIALLKMEGFTNQEIAERLDVALRTVERRLEQIRYLWSSRGDANAEA